MWRKKVGFASRVTRLAAGSPFCEGRVTVLADPAFLLTNTLTRPAGSTWSRRDNQSICEHCWLGQKGQLFFPLTQLEGDPLFRAAFLHMNGAKRDEIKLQYSPWFESIKRLALVSAVKEYSCVHILNFYVVLSLRLNRRQSLEHMTAEQMVAEEMKVLSLHFKRLNLCVARMTM